jgi:3-hydroxyisobutyrate dehydrogenase-like beta-hydroxyacid dehydrogenase
VAPGTWFLDLNSVSPGVKRQAARLIGERGARYVEAAVMAPVPPKRLATAMLLGGPHAAAFLPLAQRLGFAGAQVFSNEIGRASAAKMCRSVLVKGMEALLAESLLAARSHGVDEAVLASMRDVLPATDWRAVARYMISRSLRHGVRRAEEMREVARTLAEAGVEPSMSRACVERQSWAAQHRDAAAASTLESMLDAILAAEREREG